MPGPFRFASWWCEVEGIEELIRGSWNSSASGLRGARRVAFKLRRLKRVLREWSKTVRAARSEKKQDLLQGIQDLDLAEEEAMLDENGRAARSRAKSELAEIEGRLWEDKRDIQTNLVEHFKKPSVPGGGGSLLGRIATCHV
ncbi:hypothetical protein QJS10_CPA09g00768 [Acorus calamus]|uniref:Uncharacterized protein n=1 Tax=Acorus calamus TaxID=4465 RepID=A0AAV9E299_ACOCL|nr:hypothetical protein QJS10_CPA09g00768 [Acorus calamus]